MTYALSLYSYPYQRISATFLYIRQYVGLSDHRPLYGSE